MGFSPDPFSLAAAGLDFIGGLFSSSSQADAQREANATNLQIAKENREWQSQENLLNRNWQEKMWNAENQYNTPSAMMQRYREAGLNPYLVQKDGSSAIGSAGSAGTPSMVSAPNAASVAPVNPYSALSRLGESISLGLQSRSVDANVASQNADALLKIAQSLPELGKSLGWDNARSVALKQLGLIGVHGSQYERMIDESITSIQRDNAYKAIQNAIAQKYGDRRAADECANLEQSFTKMAAEIGKMASDREVNDATIKKLASDVVRNNADAFKAMAEGMTANALRSYLVQALQLQNGLLGLDYLSGRAEYDSNKGYRDYITSEEGISERKRAAMITGDYQSSYAARIADAIMQHLSISLGLFGSGKIGKASKSAQIGDIMYAPIDVYKP